jgi:ABC-type antimicrobial peptide transport system permease subunit
MTRIKLSLRLGIVGGIIWGLLFTAYYQMLPYITISQAKRFTFAWQSATICFVALIIIILGLPILVKEFKKAYKEGKEKQ